MSTLNYIDENGNINKFGVIPNEYPASNIKLADGTTVQDTIKGIDVTNLFTQDVAQTIFKAIKYGGFVMLIGTLATSTANATKILTFPNSIEVNESASTNYLGAISTVNGNSIPTAFRINTSGQVYLVNALGGAMTDTSYSVIVPIK